ncbi:MAG: CRISPR-associated endoribonuclease Cas6 [Candidatus Thermoplasmatota archaeon]
MRLLIKLKDSKSQVIDNTYHKLQGFVYELIRERYSSIHDKKGYKFFCFSNIFPSDNKHDVRNLIISSPSSDIIDSIGKTLDGLIDNVVNIGEMQFVVKEYKKIETRLPSSNIHVSSATPIIIRIPESRYDDYNIPSAERKKRYVYWRPHYSFEAFVKQLSENLIKKYNSFYGTRIQSYDLFEQFMFRRMVYSNLTVKGKDYPFAGSLWDFTWGFLDSAQRGIIEFGVDAGFGERNSYGLGFVNIKRNM